MCQSNVYLKKGEQQALFMEDAVYLEVEGDHVHIKDILGNRKTLHARILKAHLVEHSIILEPVSGAPHAHEAG